MAFNQPAASCEMNDVDADDPNVPAKWQLLELGIELNGGRNMILAAEYYCCTFYLHKKTYIQNVQQPEFIFYVELHYENKVLLLEIPISVPRKEESVFIYALKLLFK